LSATFTLIGGESLSTESTRTLSSGALLGLIPEEAATARLVRWVRFAERASGRGRIGGIDGPTGLRLGSRFTILDCLIGVVWKSRSEFLRRTQLGGQRIHGRC
jgi:hypothetical protein